MARLSRLAVSRIGGRYGCTLRLSGIVDETLEPETLIPLVPRDGSFAVDFDGVRRVTSFGVREWMKVAAEMPAAKPYWFVRCRPAVVAQLNMVSNFGGPAPRVVSFYAPYVCDCGFEFEALLDRRQPGLDLSSPPPVTCPDCGKQASFDDIPDAYFAWLAANPLREPPDERLVEGRPAFQLEQTVLDDVTVVRLQGTIDRVESFRRVTSGLEGTVLARLEELCVHGPVAASLAELVAKPGRRVHLVGARWELMETLPVDSPKLASALLPFRCERCTRMSELDLEPNDITGLKLTEGLYDRCPACDATRSYMLPLTTLDKVTSLLGAPVPEAARQRLAAATSQAMAAPPASASANGRVLGRYEVVKRLGAGGMGELVLARHLGPAGFEKLVAIKRIRPGGVLGAQGSEDEARKALVSEARIAARISHPNVVQVFSLEQEGPDFLMVMEYVRGWDLAALFSATTKLKVQWPVEIVARVIADVAAALGAAHAQVDEEGRPDPVVHRDVSPHNVLLSTAGAVKLTDFGLAKIKASDGATAPGTVKGKLGYHSPEQLRSLPADSRSDVFSAGVLLWELLAGRRLFRRDNIADTFRATLQEQIPQIPERALPAGIEEVLSRTLHRDPSARYRDGAELATELEEAVALSLGAATPALLARWLKDFVERAVREGAMPPSAVDALAHGSGSGKS